MKITKILAGMTAATIATMTAAALSASAVAPAAAPAAETSLAREHAKSVVARSINRDFSDGALDIGDELVSGAQKSIIQEPIEQDIPLMVLVVEFNNVKYNTEHDWSAPVFGDNYSLSEYYTDMSGGKFTFTPVEETSHYDGDTNLNHADQDNDGVVHVSLDRDHNSWAKLNDDEAYDLLTAFKEAIEEAGNYVDYASYDTNGNGMIETNELSVGIVVAGDEASFSGTQTERDFWAHSYYFDDFANMDGTYHIDYPEADGVKLNKYIGIGENLDSETIAGINTFAHELGHYLGLADYYDVDYLNGAEWSGYDMGYMSVMCNGSWGLDGAGEEFRPFSMDIVSKMILGWANVEVADKSGEYEIVADSYTGDGADHKGLVIPTKVEGEYYVLEVKDNTKWDEGLKYYVPGTTKDGGIVIYHVDERVWDELSPDDPKQEANNGDYNTINQSEHRAGLTTLNLEMDDDNKFTMIGDLVGDVDFEESTNMYGEKNLYLINEYSKSMWEHYAKEDIGDALDLPLYGAGDQKDVRAARTLSGIKVEFLDDVSNKMHVKITFPEEETVDPTDSSTPDSSSEVESTPDSSSEVESTPDSSSETVSVPDSSSETVSVPDSSSEAASSEAASSQTASSQTASSSSKVDNTAVANTGVGASLAGVAAIVTGALITVVARKRKDD